MGDLLLFCFVVAPLVYPIQFALCVYAVGLALLILLEIAPHLKPPNSGGQ